MLALARQSTQTDPIGLAGGLNLYGYAGGDPVNSSDPFGLCPGCPGFAVSAVATIAGPGFDKLNPDRLVVNNASVRLNTVMLHASLSDQHGNTGFEFKVTGGERHLNTVINGENVTSLVTSATDGRPVAGSSMTSDHLTSKGGTAIDLRINGVAASRVDEAVRNNTGFDPKLTKRDYPTAPHTHLALPRENQR